jgi:hypothetical protein
MFQVKSSQIWLDLPISGCYRGEQTLFFIGCYMRNYLSTRSVVIVPWQARTCVVHVKVTYGRIEQVQNWPCGYWWISCLWTRIQAKYERLWFAAHKIRKQNISIFLLKYFNHYCIGSWKIQRKIGRSLCKTQICRCTKKVHMYWYWNSSEYNCAGRGKQNDFIFTNSTFFYSNSIQVTAKNYQLNFPTLERLMN